MAILSINLYKLDGLLLAVRSRTALLIDKYFLFLYELAL